MDTYIDHSEVLEAFVLFENFGQTRRDVRLLARVLQKGPELLQPVQLTFVVVLESLLFELLEKVNTEGPLQTVAVESEQTLDAVS